MEDGNSDQDEIKILFEGRDDDNIDESEDYCIDDSKDEDDEERSLLRQAAEEIPEIRHRHYADRLPWLRASVLGANDGLVTTASVLLGMSAATNDTKLIIISTITAMFAGAFSMACGEFVSIAAQKDSEKAEEKREMEEFKKGKLNEARELLELADIYQKKGVSYKTALRTAKEIHKYTETDLERVVRIHLKEELNMELDNLSNPTLAAVSSFLSFLLGGAIPLMTVTITNKYTNYKYVYLAISCVVSFIITGSVGSYLSGASPVRGMIRMIIGGTLSLLCTFLLGRITGNVSA